MLDDDELTLEVLGCKEFASARCSEHRRSNVALQGRRPKRTSCDHFLADSSIGNLVTQLQIEIRTILPSILKCLNIEMEIEIDIDIDININININKIL